MADIKALPPDVAAQIKSSTTISSLSDVVFGLIENAFDANASRIDISIDFGRASCSVEDDGCGISPADFHEDGGLGKPHHTSKYGNDTELHRSRGTFLSSVAALSILSITSRHRAYSTTNALILHHSKVVSRLAPAPVHMQLASREHGTKVVVHDLFGNMPVRVMQRPADDAALRSREKEWASTCHTVTGMALALGRPIFLTMKASDKDQVYRIRTLPNIPNTKKKPGDIDHAGSFDTSLIRSTLVQGLGLDPASWSSWIKTSARAAFITVRAIISLEPAPSRQLQFISLQDRYISPVHGLNALYDTVNQLFLNSSFAVQEEELGKRAKEAWLTNRQLKGAGRGVDRWPMFYIRIGVRDRGALEFDQPGQSPLKNNTLHAITEMLGTMVTGFLKEHHLRPVGSRGTKARSSPRKGSSRLLRASASPEFHQLNGELGNRPIKQAKSKPTQEAEKSPRIFGDLEKEVKFPQAHKNMPLREPLNATLTSRIKTSSRCDLDALLDGTKLHAIQKQSANVNLSHDSITSENTITSENAKEQTEPPAYHQPEEDARQQDGTVQSSHDETDDMIRWIRPVTKESLLLNARTGCAIIASPDSRPTSVDEKAMQACVGRNQESGQKRLVRTSSGLAQPEEGSWVSSFFDNWDNPVFQRSEEAIPRVSSETLEDSSHGFSATLGRTFQNPTLPLQSRLSKMSLSDAAIISQVDSKFILIKARNKSESSAEDSWRNILVLVDQHAADERVKVERLLEELCTRVVEDTKTIISPLGYRSSIATTSLQRPMFFELHNRENAIFRRHAVRFAKWGILYDLVSTHTGPSTIESQSACRLVVLTLPPGIAERCRVEPKLLIEMLRSEAWKLEESKRGASSTINHMESSSRGETNRTTWLQRIVDCPQGILDMLNSRSCRSAIMFNDELSLEQCRDLIRNLADCQFPFQCAHGRPTMVPLVDLGGLQDLGDAGESSGPRASKGLDFRTAWSQWAAAESI